ncbi:MAG: hypothetical protein ACO2YV_02375, partial [Pseudomonadales bacterium]
MDFEIPADLRAYLKTLDEFIEAEIKPLQAQDDNERFFDHRREWALGNDGREFEPGDIEQENVHGTPKHAQNFLLGRTEFANVAARRA